MVIFLLSFFISLLLWFHSRGFFRKAGYESKSSLSLVSVSVLFASVSVVCVCVCRQGVDTVGTRCQHGVLWVAIEVVCIQPFRDSPANAIRNDVGGFLLLGGLCRFFCLKGFLNH